VAPELEHDVYVESNLISIDHLIVSLRTAPRVAFFLLFFFLSFRFIKAQIKILIHHE